MYNRVVDDLMSWMEDVESQLLSEDHGKDLYSVNKLLKKHQVTINFLIEFTEFKMLHIVRTVSSIFFPFSS